MDERLALDEIPAPATSVSLKLIQDPQYRRFKTTVDMDTALDLYNTPRFYYSHPLFPGTLFLFAIFLKEWSIRRRHSSSNQRRQIPLGSWATEWRQVSRDWKSFVIGRQQHSFYHPLRETAMGWPPIETSVCPAPISYSVWKFACIFPFLVFTNKFSVEPMYATHSSMQRKKLCSSTQLFQPRYFSY